MSKNKEQLNFRQLRMLFKDEHRSKLMKHGTIKWLKKRHQDTSQKKYLLLPQEVKVDNEYRLIFQTFDENNSMSLDIQELYHILQEFGVKVNKKDLVDLFETIDQQSDHLLSYEEFKKCATSEISDEVFRKIIRKVIENEKKDIEKQIDQEKRNRMCSISSDDDEEQKQIKQIQKENDIKSKLKYYPLTFGTMMQYLSYQMKRKNLMKKIDQNQNIAEKFAMIKQLINMQSPLDNNSSNSTINHYKQQLKLSNCIYNSLQQKRQSQMNYYNSKQSQSQPQTDNGKQKWDQNINSNDNSNVLHSQMKFMKINNDINKTGTQIESNRDVSTRDNIDKVNILKSSMSNFKEKNKEKEKEKFNMVYEKKLQMKQNYLQRKQDFIYRKQKQSQNILEQLNKRNNRLSLIKTCQQQRLTRKLSQIDSQNIQFMNQYKTRTNEDLKVSLYNQFISKAQTLKIGNNQSDFIRTKSNSIAGLSR